MHRVNARTCSQAKKAYRKLAAKPDTQLRKQGTLGSCAESRYHPDVDPSEKASARPSELQKMSRSYAKL